MEHRNRKLINIDWDGPIKLSELSKITDSKFDYSIYQIYGSHNVYGSNTLLYIGKADRQTIGMRISQEHWWWKTSDPNNLQIYCDRLAGEKTPSENQWLENIYNTQNLFTIPDRLHKIRILKMSILV